MWPDVRTASNCPVWGGGRLFKHALPSTLKAVAGSFMLSLGLFFRLTVAELRQMYNDTKSDFTPILSSIFTKTYIYTVN